MSLLTTIYLQEKSDHGKGLGMLCVNQMLLFNKMITECLENEEYAAAFKSKGPQVSAESLFMVLIFQQQKMISKLIEKI
jgi:hypothetical protein